MLKSNVDFHNSKLVSIPDKQKLVTPLKDISGGKTKDEKDSKREEVPSLSSSAWLSTVMVIYCNGYLL